MVILIVDDEIADFESTAQLVRRVCKRKQLKEKLDFTIEHAPNYIAADEFITKHADVQTPLLLIFDMRWVKLDEHNPGDFIVKIVNSPDVYWNSRPIIIVSALDQWVYPSSALKQFLDSHPNRITLIHRMNTDMGEKMKLVEAAIDALRG